MSAHPPAHEVPEPWHDEGEVEDDHFTMLPRFCGICVILATLALWAAMVGVWLLTSALLASGAYAHQAVSGMPYNTWCCNGNGQNGDCQEIPDSAVRTIPGGYQITLQVGDHRLVTRSHIFTKTQAETRWSTDGRYHACLYPTEDELRCFYAPPPGV
jgi:hypothetical protein